MTGYQHLLITFEQAERLHPDLMEPYSTRLGEAVDRDEKIDIMRAGLRETFRGRFPMPVGCAWRDEAPPSSAHTDSKSIAAPDSNSLSSPLHTQSTGTI